MVDPLRVLLIEDSEDDEVLLLSELEKGGFKDIFIKRVETGEEMLSSLDGGSWDLIISDFALPSFDGLSALAILKDAGIDIPFIIVSGKIGEETAVEAMKAGAQDYIMKGNLIRLNSAIIRELEDARVRARTKAAEEEIRVANEVLKERSKELEDINQHLLEEVKEREKAESDALEAHEYMSRMIDSTSDLIVSFDRLHRVKIWNQAMERLTSFSREEVLNRSLDRLKVFDDPRKVKGAIDLVYQEKQSPSIEIVLKTKRRAKKILDASASVVLGTNKDEIGVFIMGKDITPMAEVHGRLVGGMCYLVRDKETVQSVNLFKDLVRSDRSGLVITRANPDLVRSEYTPSEDTKVMLMSEIAFDGMENIKGLGHLADVVEDFVSENSESAVLIDGVHYLLVKNQFKDFMETLFRISDSISRSQSICLIRVDPAILEDGKMAILENELVLLPSQRIADIIVSDETYDLLRYISEQNAGNTLVSFKKVMSRFKLSYVTVANRVEELEDEGLVFTKRKGKLRAIYITDMGKALMDRRESL